MTEQNTPKMTHDEMIDTLKGLVFGTFDRTTAKEREALNMAIEELEQETKTGHCKDCKYFEYSVERIPFIVAHDICSKWGDECRTKENGYCYLFEPQEMEVQDANSN